MASQHPFEAWTEEELDILKEYFPTEGASIQKRLPRHSIPAIYQRAHRLGVSVDRQHCNRSWDEDEMAVLREFYPIEGRDVAKRLPWRTEAACKTQANKMGLKAPPRKHKEYVNHWTEEEDRILRDFFPIEGQAVSKRLPNRTDAACLQRAYSLRLKYISGRNTTEAHKKDRYNRWTAQEDQILRDFFPTEGKAVCQRLPNRTTISCIQRAHKLGLKLHT